ncbi:hypothetical protein H632_c678p0 [Helicosporidium sp. ATCC 50920]|nr:hypothetical protein H632_c678p0 [Helicosporidium sp. ATCC 50920]|eukprot:KDD75452.1 hypothetical protein H632_c678p0 [Helicosporidium sp. ATCC 50920]
MWPHQGSPLPPPEPYDWEGDRPLRPAPESLVIYELHVRGFTRDAGSGVDHPGTYRGLQDRLDYLQGLGVTALELLPVQEFNELEYYKASQPSRVNFWGYSTLSFFSPMARYATSAAAPDLPHSSPLEALNEFRDFVKAAHRRGLAIILDVVFNHTTEGSEAGLSLSFRGVDNRAFYMLAPAGQCYNYSGCGNTFNANHPSTSAFVRDCLRWWVLETHVDGFRFDLASILTRAPSMWAPHGGCDGDDQGAASRSEAEASTSRRPTGIFPRPLGDETGTPLGSPPLVEALSADAALAGTLFIAEPWDCGGLNQAGAFPHYGGRWMEWNGPFRDAVRSFVKGTSGAAEAFASALAGSPQMYGGGEVPDAWWATAGGSRWLGGRGSRASVNLITSHDGFSLSDLCSFNRRHNDDNGEEGRDGEAHNLSWNCGEEGDAGDRRVSLLRARQRRNLLAALLLARGVPMLCQGDEAGHTKRGNNNTYCHDSNLNYLCWNEALEDAEGLRRFVRALLTLRKRYGAVVGGAELQWLGKDAETGSYPESARLVACCCPGENGQGIVLAFNAGHTPGHVSLPRWEGLVWQRVVDTSQASPLDVLLPDELLSEEGVREAHRAWGPWQEAGELPLLPYSCAVLVSTPAAKGWDPPQWAL